MGRHHQAHGGTSASANSDAGRAPYRLALRRHYFPLGDVSENYSKLTEPLLHKEIAVQGKIGDARAYWSTLPCGRVNDGVLGAKPRSVRRWGTYSERVVLLMERLSAARLCYGN